MPGRPSFQSAPRASTGGNVANLVADVKEAKFQSAPRASTGRNAVQTRPLGCIAVSIRPPRKHGGKQPPAAAGGRTHRFNPPPAQARGETRANALSADGFAGFNPPPAQARGET